jgi:hypothetical protein
MTSSEVSHRQRWLHDTKGKGREWGKRRKVGCRVGEEVKAGEEEE